ncbi:MAG: histidine phosphatase family protein [Pseudarcicella sp.]|jgi:phosphohistidine phosphatase|nr:histidine phosphatase family protein [Pseudarcicella sp.]MBP6410558.1 histidine phosphatase family protein [Pseudarcicella sp.]
MKKTIYLVRHAQASENVSPDLIRPLTTNGFIDAARMGKHLASSLTNIDLIVSSNAERTQMTAQVFTEQLKIDDINITIKEELYESSPKHYLEAINAFSEEISTVMLVGHNPSISYIAEFLCHEEIGSMPTCGVVGLEFIDLKWSEIHKNDGNLLFYDSPDSILGVKI